MKEKKKARKQYKKIFRDAMNKELRENKTSFIVFNTLRLLIIFVFVRQLFNHSYETAFLCILSIVLLYIPSWVQVRLHINLPPALEITIFCFIFATEILGEIDAFYIKIPMWDTILHTLNGFLAAGVGYSVVSLLNDDDRLTFDLSPLFLSLVAFCFSMTIGVLWEFFEFGMDLFFHLDMQKDTVVNAIYSVALDPAKLNNVTAITGITEVTVNGQDLGLGGYLDLGIIDTMKDLFVNFIGAVVFSVIGFFYASTKGRRGGIVQSFTPTKKGEGNDYLKNGINAESGLSGGTGPAEKETAGRQ